METCKRNKKPRTYTKYAKSRIIKKYDKLVEKTIDRMKDQSMSELWCELDKLKEQMAKEFKEKGIPLES